MAYKSDFEPTITGSVQFDGTDDYIIAPESSSFTMTGDFTLECWIYPFDVSGIQVIMNGRGISNSGGPVLYMNGTTLIHDNGTGTVNTVSSGIPLANKWYHIAGTREGTTWRLFINGIKRDEDTNTTSYTTDEQFAIGRSHASEYYHGLVSNARVLNGTALYKQDFVPSTTPLTNITNTVLLCCQSDTSTTAAAVIPSGSLTANGSPVASKLNPMDSNIDTVQSCLLYTSPSPRDS